MNKRAKRWNFLSKLVIVLVISLYVLPSIASAVTEVFVNGNFINEAACINEGLIFENNCFNSIQGGVDGVSEGGTVNVAPGEYIEYVNIHKNGITLQSISSSDDTTIIGDTIIIIESENCIYVDADDVTIDDFTITFCGTGVYAYWTEGLKVLRNEIFNTENGVYLDEVGGESEEITITLVQGNYIHNNSDGIYVDESYDVEIVDNVVENNNGFDDDSGIHIEYSEDIILSRNEIFDHDGTGVYIYYSQVYLDRNNIHNNTDGISAEYSTTVVAEGNFIHHNVDGIVSSYGSEEDSLYVFDSRIQDNEEYGIFVYDDYLEAENNNIRNNNVGVYVSTGSAEASANINYNNIVGNSEDGVSTGGDEFVFVDAENNYWGCVEGPGEGENCDSVGRNVEIDPFLCTEFENPFLPEICEPDADGLNDLLRLIWGIIFGTGTDSDGDGLDDDEEILIYFTDPNNPDTDGDGISDGDEVNNTPPYDPKNPDEDNDGILDGNDEDFPI